MRGREAILFRERNQLPKAFRKYRFNRIHFCKAIETRPRRVSMPTSDFDYILASSENALRFAKTLPRARKVIKHLHGDQILRFFKARENRKQRILYLRSSLGAKLGRSDIVPDLRQLGYRVSVRSTYHTKILPITRRLKDLLRRPEVRSFLVTSPSTVEAVRRALSMGQLRQLRPRWICIGPTTAAHLRRLKIL